MPFLGAFPIAALPTGLPIGRAATQFDLQPALHNPRVSNAAMVLGKRCGSGGQTNQLTCTDLVTQCMPFNSMHTDSFCTHTIVA